MARMRNMARIATDPPIHWHPNSGRVRGHCGSNAALNRFLGPGQGMTIAPPPQNSAIV